MINLKLNKNRYKIALITGITGQDGAYLSQILLEKNYIVFGAHRKKGLNNFWRLKELGIFTNKNLFLVPCDLLDLSNCVDLLTKIMPNEIYNLASQSFVNISFEQSITTAQINGIGTLNLIEAVRLVNTDIRFFQASSSEMFGKVQTTPQNEETFFYPRNPYGIAKLFAHWTSINYREKYNIFASCGILYNHESPLRGQEFVTRKITHSVAKIKHNKLDVLEIGNLNSRRDWGFAKEYAEGMWLIMQSKEPETYILSTNKATTVREFVQWSFKSAGIGIEFKGKAENETAFDTCSGKTVLRINPKFYRPDETDLLIGDSTKAQTKLGWKAKTNIEQLCHMMVESDIIKVKKID